MQKIPVLFMQSQSFFGSDSMIHSLIMRHLDRDRFQVHVACEAGRSGQKSASLAQLETIPNLHVRATRFGPTLHHQSPTVIMRQIATEAGPALTSLVGLATYAKQHGIRIVHGTEKPRDAFYGYLLARLIGAKCITHLHVKVEPWISPLVRWAMKRNDALVAVSDFVARSAEDMGYAPSKTYSALNAIDVSPWDPSLDGQNIRDELQIEPNTTVLAIISRLFPWKGHTELLKALARVRPEHPSFHLLVVGEDDPRATPGGGSYLRQLKELTTALGLDRHVTFTGFRTDIPQLLAAADLFAMPTFEEPCAVAFLEAMAMSKAVIALDSGGTPELVEHGACGLLSPPRDVERLAANLLALLRDPERRWAMGADGRRRVEELFTPKRLARDVEWIYEQLVGVQRSPPLQAVRDFGGDLQNGERLPEAAS